MLFPKSKEVSFLVRACEEASVLLQTETPDIWGRNMFEVVLGGGENYDSSIRFYQSAEILASSPTPGLLDCDR